jgi:hypothetical protein
LSVGSSSSHLRHAIYLPDVLAAGEDAIDLRREEQEAMRGSFVLTAAVALLAAPVTLRAQDTAPMGKFDVAIKLGYVVARRSHGG